MKNNQFKKQVRKIIEDECKTFDFQSLYVDENKNKRMIYIYNLEWRFVGLFSCWFNNNGVHLSFTNLVTLPLIQHKVKEINAKYVEFNRVVQVIEECFNIMDKTEG